MRESIRVRAVRMLRKPGSPRPAHAMSVVMVALHKTATTAIHGEGRPEPETDPEATRIDCRERRS
jgi:hypothetical protein